MFLMSHFNHLRIKTEIFKLRRKPATKKSSNQLKFLLRNRSIHTFRRRLRPLISILDYSRSVIELRLTVKSVLNRTTNKGSGILNRKQKVMYIFDNNILTKLNY